LTIVWNNPGACAALPAGTTIQFTFTGTANYCFGAGTILSCPPPNPSLTYAVTIPFTNGNTVIYNNPYFYFNSFVALLSNINSAGCDWNINVAVASNWEYIFNHS